MADLNTAEPDMKYPISPGTPGERVWCPACRSKVLIATFRAAKPRTWWRDSRPAHLLVQCCQCRYEVETPLGLVMRAPDHPPWLGIGLVYR